MPKLELLIGMIGSGKSTYARRRAAQGALVVSMDALCHHLHAGNPVGPNACGYEPELRERYRMMEETMAFEVLFAGRDLIIDRTHLTRAARDRWIGFATRTGMFLKQEIPVVAVVFPIEDPEVHALHRFTDDNRGRSYEQWLAVARHHHDQAAKEPLRPEEEGFSAVQFVPFVPNRNDDAEQGVAGV